MRIKQAFLFRTPSDEQGTLGVLTALGFSCRTIELPWKDNEPDVSCIPVGIYKATMRMSPKFGWMYWVQNVQGRMWILCHYGNLAGDVSRGWKTHSEGCIIVGKYHGKLNGQKAVLLSRPTLRRFVEHMNKEEFELTIENI